VCAAPAHLPPINEYTHARAHSLPLWLIVERCRHELPKEKTHKPGHEWQGKKKEPRSSRGTGLPGLPRGDVASAYYNSARQFLVSLPAATYAGATSVRWGSKTSQAQQVFDLKWISRVRRHHTHARTTHAETPDSHCQPTGTQARPVLHCQHPLTARPAVFYFCSLCFAVHHIRLFYRKATPVCDGLYQPRKRPVQGVPRE
jgi:hypothetical protein